MALIAMEGFERLESSVIPPITVAVSGGGSVSYPAGRFGGYAVCNNNTNIGGMYRHTYVQVNTNANKVFVGLAAYMNAASSSYHFLAFNTASGEQVWMDAAADGSIHVYRGSTEIGATPAFTYPWNGWNYFEMSAVIHATAGEVVVRANGYEVLRLTNVNTLNSGTAGNITSIVARTLADAYGSGARRIDDLYVCDDTGILPYNTFLGDIRIEAIVPSGNGAASGLVGSDADSVDNYLLVDEIPASATDYVGSQTAGATDLYTYSSLSSSSGQALAVEVRANVFKSDANTAAMSIVEHLSSGTERISTATALTATPSWITTGPRTDDPASSPWTITSINSTQFGVKVE